MRLKSLPLSTRTPGRPPQSPARPPRIGLRSTITDKIATLLMIGLVPALMIPLLVIHAAGPTLVLAPSDGVPGTSIVTRGTGFDPGARGDLTLGATRVTRFHADKRGTFSATFVIPATTKYGIATVAAVSGTVGKRTLRASTVLATATLTVLDPTPQTSATPTPTRAPTATPSATRSASPTPTSTRSPSPTPVVTAAPTATPAFTHSPTPTPTATRAPTPTTAPTATAAPAAIKHVVMVWMENEEAAGVTATSMPYLYGLSQTYGRADQFYGVTHPSLPNYLALWSGSTHGVTDDRTHNLSAPSLSSQLTAVGKSWRGFMQDYPTTSGCHTASSYSGGIDGWGVSGTYARKHDPMMSFTSVSGSTTECAKVQPLASFNTNAAVTFVAPNLCNDMHDCSLKTGDDFLKAFLPQVFNSPNWSSTLLLVSFDEGSTTINGGGRIFTVIARQGMGHIVSSQVHNHYSVTRTIENLFGLPCLANACSASPINEFLP